MVYTIQCYSEDQIEEDEMGCVYDMYEKEEKSIQGPPGTS